MGINFSGQIRPSTGGESSGGGSIDNALTSLRFGRGNTNVKGLMDKGDNIYIQNSTSLIRMTRFSEGGDFMLNSGKQTSDSWKSLSITIVTLSSIYGMFSVNKDDDFIYITGRTNTSQPVLIRYNIMDDTQALVTGDVNWLVGQENWGDYDNGKLYIFEAGDIKEFTLDGLNATYVTNYVYPNPPFRRSFAVVKNGYAYYRDSENNSSQEINTLIRLKLSDLSTKQIQAGSYDGDFNGVFGYTGLANLFKYGSYVYVAGVVHDSEDYVDWELSVIDKPVA